MGWGGWHPRTPTGGDGRTGRANRSADSHTCQQQVHQVGTGRLARARAYLSHSGGTRPSTGEDHHRQAGTHSHGGEVGPIGALKWGPLGCLRAPRGESSHMTAVPPSGRHRAFAGPDTGRHQDVCTPSQKVGPSQHLRRGIDCSHRFAPLKTRQTCSPPHPNRDREIHKQGEDTRTDRRRHAHALAHTHTTNYHMMSREMGIHSQRHRGQRDQGAGVEETGSSFDRVRERLGSQATHEAQWKMAARAQAGYGQGDIKTGNPPDQPHNVCSFTLPDCNRPLTHWQTATLGENPPQRRPPFVTELHKTQRTRKRQNTCAPFPAEKPAESDIPLKGSQVPRR